MTGASVKDQTLLSAATSGTSLSVDVSQFKNWTVVFQSNGTTSGGTILVEEAYWPSTEQDYTGTWSLLYTMSASTFSGGAQVALHYGNNNTYRRVRVRISSNITGGGTVTVYLNATE